MQYTLPSLALLLAAVVAQETPSLADALSGTPSLSQLATLISLVPGLSDTLAGLEGITIFAPSNEAVEALGENAPTDPVTIGAILSYHVLAENVTSDAITNQSQFVPTALSNLPAFANVTGGQVVEVVNREGTVFIFSGLGANSTVTEADIAFTGGTIHIIDSVLTLPANASTTASQIPLTYLVGALTAASLVETVDTLTDITVFAPSNAGFEAIGSALEGASVEDLTSILTYHVVNGTVGYSADLSDGQTLTAVSGGELTISIEDGTVFVNGASVTTPNILLANGVLHVIDNVLNPASSATPDAGATAGAPAFSGASSVSDSPFTSGVPAPSSTIPPRPTPTPDGGEGQTSAPPEGIAAPMRTGAAGMAALFGAAAVFIV